MRASEYPPFAPSDFLTVFQKQFSSSPELSELLSLTMKLATCEAVQERVQLAKRLGALTDDIFTREIKQLV
jgi:hypothetical protein